MSNGLYFWGIIVGALGITVAILAVLQDQFDFIHTWKQSKNPLKMLVVNRRFQAIIILLLSIFFFWSQSLNVQYLKETNSNLQTSLTTQRQKESELSDIIRSLESTIDAHDATHYSISPPSTLPPVNVQIDSISSSKTIVKQGDTLTIIVDTKNTENRVGAVSIGLSIQGPDNTIQDIPWQTTTYESFESKPVYFEVNLDSEALLGEYTIISASWSLCDENISGEGKCLEPNYSRLLHPSAFEVVE